jgi:hypothetical protein
MGWYAVGKNDGRTSGYDIAETRVVPLKKP